MIIDDNLESTSTQSNIKLPVNLTQEDIEKKVLDLVRLAISSSVTDIPLKREEIKKKVIKDNMRIFPIVFEEAQKILRDTYCMELVEYPARGSTILSINQSNILNSQQQLQQGDAQTIQASQTNSSQVSLKKVSSKKYSTNSYILRNLIPGNLRKGLIFNKEDYQLHGLLIIILCLIYANGNRVKEEIIYKYLEKFGLYKNIKHETFEDVEKHIIQFTQKGYLEKEKTPIPNSEEVTYSYKWGPRALVEFPEKNLLNFIKGFYEKEEQEQIVKELIRSRGIN
ncbi:MAGE-domain-containing protein [Anaeromyces robustus]|uniref:MAGE-domain-containing protein n=1 Tax=Anaeromyces robustus TaxID=1754192 RepID=A0A1Y1WXI5_9FUNG|nr:MAGE-domain-containing protein [Anaeromyces robustus]|eukprot:ORX78261.1 MAGE-domain-containing protein [Anaeromyces robustus]